MLKKFLNQLYQSTKHSLDGIYQAIKIERSFRWEAYLSVPLFLIICLIEVPTIERILLLFPILATLSCEMLNSSIEKTIDELGNGKITPQFKYAKDCGAAAVFFMIIMTLITWALILWPYIQSAT